MKKTPFDESPNPEDELLPEYQERALQALQEAAAAMPAPSALNRLCRIANHVSRICRQSAVVILGFLQKNSSISEGKSGQSIISTIEPCS